MIKINSTEISTQNQLEKCLNRIGFKTKPATFKNIIIIRDTPTKFTDEPVLWLPAMENKLELECVISIEQNALYIYYYEFFNDRFKVWDRYQTEISEEELRATIVHVTQIENLTKKYNENS